MKHTRWISLLLAMVMLTMTVLSSCTAATSPPREDEADTEMVETFTEETVTSLTATSAPHDGVDLRAWAEETLAIQNTAFRILEIRCYYITEEMLDAYRLLANPTTEKAFGFRMEELSPLFDRGSAITVLNNQVVEAATIYTSDHDQRLVDCEEIDWDRFFGKLALAGGLLILTAVLAPITGGTVSCALMTCCTAALIEATASYGTTALMKTAEGLLEGKSLADSVQAALTANATVQAFADGFLMGALVGSISTLFMPMCFPANTPVLTDKGYTPIEEIRPGDCVVSFHEESGTIEVSTVFRTHTRTAPALVEIRLSDGGVVEATPEHPFYCVASRSWVAAGALRSGDLLMTPSGETLSVVDVRYSEKTAVPVYNLTVERTHTYFVGSGGGEAVLVHNTCAYQNSDALYEIGTYGELKAARRGNSAYKGLDAHHIPSKHFLKTYGIDPDDAVAIMIPHGTHKKTLSFGRWSKDKKAFYSQLSPDDALRLDLSNLRGVLRNDGVADPAVFKHVDQIADYCRKLYPHLFP